jgi:hypothetical protein
MGICMPRNQVQVLTILQQKENKIMLSDLEVYKQKKLLNFLRSFLVGDEGFEPPTPSV